MTDDERGELKADLTEAGVKGADDLGRFVSNTKFFRSSQFDEKNAMPVLLDALPTLSEPAVIIAVAGHLRRPWARPKAFPALLEAFERWAPIDQQAGWALGDALATAATATQLDQLLVISRDTALGTTRQMVVYSLGRYRRYPEVAPVLVKLLDDPDVSLHAISALRRVVGPAAALPLVEQAARRHEGTPLGRSAAREARKIRKATSA
ncbi:MAG: hypothetical protein L0H96_19885 [Humibacillus sp.]|nr:hypothetical protein [Humibacillus sp.]MDN5779158.1 hypothetical protein [Humibacillus sp.]